MESLKVRDPAVPFRHQVIPTLRLRRPGKPSRKPHVHVKQAGVMHCTAVYTTADDRDGEGLAIRCKDSKNAHKLKTAIRDAYDRGRMDGVQAAHKVLVRRYIVATTGHPMLASFDEPTECIKFMDAYSALYPAGSKPRLWFTDVVAEVQAAPTEQEAMRTLRQRVAGLEEAQKGAAA